MVLFTGSPLQISAHVFLCCLLHSLFGWWRNTDSFTFDMAIAASASALLGWMSVQG